MAERFGTAIYTNCAPGQGIDKVAGMQWQARSEGIGRDVLDIVRKHLIYEPPRLSSDALDVSEYPGSFAHVSDGILATAAGVYLGREAVGNRRGNHLTNAVIATDPAAYRSIRPAQLFGAPFWRTSPADSTVSAPMPDNWSPGLDAITIGRFVAGQPRGTELLCALLTALKYPESIRHRRIVFIGEQVEPIVTWLAAATLLLPQARAVRIGFKFFTSDPARSALQVVAVHPRWTSFAATVENDFGYAIFDLFRGKWSEVPVDEDARRWVGLFTDENPYDVSEAVELAAASGLAVDAAFELARAGVLAITPGSSHADTLFRWLTTGPETLREAYGGTVLTALGTSRDPAVLQRCDELSATAYPERRDELRLHRLEVELEQATTASPSWTPSGGSVILSGEMEPLAREHVMRRLAAASGPAFDGVLRVAKRFSVPVDLAAVRPVVTDFIADWVNNPSRSYDPAMWPADLPVLDLVRDELVRRLAEDPEDARRVGDRWWRILWVGDRRALDPRDSVDRALAAAAMVHSAPEERLEIVRDVLPASPGLSDSSRLRERAAVLWSRTAMRVEEARLVMRLLRPGTDVGQAPFEGLLLEAERSDPTSITVVEICEELHRHRLLTLPPAISAMVADLKLLIDTADQIGKRAVAPSPDTGRRLNRLPPRLIRAGTGRLVETLSRYQDLRLLHDWLSVLPDHVVGEFLRFWPARRSVMPTPAWMAISFYLVHQPFAGAHADATAAAVMPECRAELEAFARQGSEKELADARLRLSRLDPAYADAWKAFLADRRPGSLVARAISGISRLLRGRR
ncbi:hypothetical protein [Actinoplanes regularis]|uniref:GAP1-N2 domain-containing protein n=1 Tax=Actinoplanes regularis TaxID=52697 RepID=UPI0024A22B7C|nr:hypothetical protein [Actinoplanes regularis]GLW29812.1 hypothetical protein Areg01_27520 [Actinoplanes regularis]